MAPGSEDVLLLKDQDGEQTSGAHQRCSTCRALVIAGLASLLCLLVCCQIVTFYFLLKQMAQINELQNSKNGLSTQVSSLSQGNSQLGMWIMESRLDQWEASASAQDSQRTHTAEVEKLQNSSLQNLNLTLLNGPLSENLLRLEQQMNKSEWKSFETWMQNWLIFQRAQQTSAANASQTKTKCQMQAEAAGGSYKPQCDASGHYTLMQCYSSTGYCWCVDSDGKRVPDTLKKGKPNCWYYSEKYYRDGIIDDFK